MKKIIRVQKIHNKRIGCLCWSKLTESRDSIFYKFSKIRAKPTVLSTLGAAFLLISRTAISDGSQFLANGLHEYVFEMQIFIHHLVHTGSRPFSKSIMSNNSGKNSENILKCVCWFRLKVCDGCLDHSFSIASSLKWWNVLIQFKYLFSAWLPDKVLFLNFISS